MFLIRVGCKRLSGGDTVVANLGATESSKISAGAEFVADILGESTNVGAGGDVGTDFELWVVVAKDFDIVDFNFTRRNCKILTFASEFVGTLAANFDSTEFGWSLDDFTNEAI